MTQETLNSLIIICFLLSLHLENLTIASFLAESFPNPCKLLVLDCYYSKEQWKEQDQKLDDSQYPLVNHEEVLDKVKSFSIYEDSDEGDDPNEDQENKMKKVKLDSEKKLSFVKNAIRNLNT